MKLWVDMNRIAPKGWIWARGYSEAKRILNEYDWDFDVISVDYSYEEGRTGLDLLKDIERRTNEYQNYLPFIGVHATDVGERELMVLLASRLNAKRLRKR